MVEYRWRKCILCGYYYRAEKKTRRNSGNLKYSASMGCLVCNYRDKKDMYYRQLLLDLNNKVYDHGEWVVSNDETRVPERLERTLAGAYRYLGPVIAEDVFYRAIDTYWYNKYFTQASLKP